jgi:hypothetical protein
VDSTAPLFILLALVAIIAIRLAAGAMDKSRIADYIRQQGGRVFSISWAPFGTGWFGEKNARIYEVVYYDANGNQHMATCKTSMMGGVYWTEDRISHRKAAWFSELPEKNRAGAPLIRAIPERSEDHAASENDRLRQENERLNEELRRLKGEA